MWIKLVVGSVAVNHIWHSPYALLHDELKEQINLFYYKMLK